MINDPSGGSEQFADQDIQDQLDASRDDIRFEGLKIAPSIVNSAATNNVASTIFADYYSAYQWWEDDVILQGYSNGAAWVVITPTLSENIVGHWQFEGTTLSYIFTSATVPGQLPPVFATGKVYDVYDAAANLLEFWGATQAASYDFSADGQAFKRSQMMLAKLKLADYFRKKAKPRVAKMTRPDVMAPIGSRRMRLLDSDDVVKGA